MAKKILNYIKQGFLSDINCGDDALKTVLLICAILTVPIIISFFVPVFALITCLLACASLVLLKGAKKIYILIYLLPFYHVLRLTSDGFVLSSIILGATIVFMGIEYIVDIIKKRKDPQWVVTILFLAIVIYSILPFGPLNLGAVSRFVCTITILYLVYVNKEDLDFKAIVLMLSLGLLVACLLEPFRDVSSRLELFLPNFYGGLKRNRFAGLTSDPNYFSVEVILVLACLVQLFFGKKLKLIFYPLFLFFSLIGLLTFSKSFFIAYVVLFIIMIVYMIVKIIKGKNNHRKNLAIFLLCGLLLLSIASPLIDIIMDRFTNGSYVSFDETFGSDILNTFTTGRSEIWIMYFKDIFSSPVTALFGHGLGGELPITNHGETSAHNFYIECLYCFGIVGTLLIVSLCVYLFIRTSTKQNRQFRNFIPLVAIAIMLLSLNSLVSYRPYVLIIVLAYSINLKKHKINNEKGEENAKSISNNECL